MNKKLLLEVKEYIEHIEERQEWDRGQGHGIKQMIAEKDMPNLYYKIIKLINKAKVIKNETIKKEKR